MSNVSAIAIVLSTFNPAISSGLLKGAEEVLKKANVPFEVFRVPGSFEIPLMAQKLSRIWEGGRKYKAILALGCVIKGETKHFELVAKECARGCMQVMLEEEVPVVFEVLACTNEKQALARSRGKFNRGRLGAEVALWWLKSL